MTFLIKQFGARPYSINFFFSFSEYLKQLRRNRDEEAKLMANVPGWEVGTWYGEPVYKLLPKDTLVDPHFKEFYAHTDYKHLSRRYHLRQMS